MIISASRRTDIPAFYTPWLMERLDQGYCVVPNPYNPKQQSRVSLVSNDVEALVFWTRNAAPLLPHMQTLLHRGLEPFFLVTLTGYPQRYEPFQNPPELVVKTLEHLGAILSPSRIVWRYDPIILSHATPPAWHIKNFSSLSTQLREKVDHVIFSVLDMYRSVQRRFRLLPENFQPWEGRTLLQGLEKLCPELARIASKNNIPCQSCADPRIDSAWGITPGGCIDSFWIRRNLRVPLTELRDTHQRKNCLCVAAKDIGMYHSCGCGCVYCYGGSRKSEEERRKRHDPLKESLFQTLISS